LRSYRARLSGVAGLGGQRLGLAAPGLDGWFLVGADDVVAGVQALALPEARVQVEDRAGALGEARVAREDPGAMPPGLDRVLAEPTPDGHARDLLADAAVDGFARELCRGPA
jgi:hypothetical protein